MDIAYCTCQSCPCKDCRRHMTNAPHFVPVTIANFSEDGTGPCAYYWPTIQREE